MKEFIMAALPWVILGLALAIFLIIIDNRKESEKENNGGTRMPIGMCIGMSAGIIVGLLGLFDVGVGMCIGLLLGMIGEVLFYKRKG